MLSVDYRLSSGPPFERRNPFPAAVTDGIAAYKYLGCEVGFLPQNITVGDDSAGGNLALAVTRYIVEGRLPHVPPPGGLIASSPWGDMSFSRAEISSSHFLNTGSGIFDLLLNTHPLIARKAPIGAYIGGMDPEETKYNRYLSPASKFVIAPNDAKFFSGFPRSYIMGGGAEHLFDDIVALAERMRDNGVDITTEPASAGPSRKAGIEAIFFRGLRISQSSRSNLFLPHRTLEVTIIQYSGAGSTSDWDDLKGVVQTSKPPGKLIMKHVGGSSPGSIHQRVRCAALGRMSLCLPLADTSIASTISPVVGRPLVFVRTSSSRWISSRG